MKIFRRSKYALGVLAMLTPAAASRAATVLDLTAANLSGQVTVGDTIFERTDIQPTGTGVIDSFVRIQPTGNADTGEGYNTDYRPLQYDENYSPIFTRSLPLSALSTTTINGTTYYRFLLDINEPNDKSDGLISLDQVELYLGNAPDLHNYVPGSGFGADATSVYNMDAISDVSILLDASLNNGSGSGDMWMYVPTADFTGPNQYVYLFSHFGDVDGMAGGFEEWASVLDPVPGSIPPPGPTPPPTSVPLTPGAPAGLAALIAAAGCIRRLKTGVIA
jgi:hypothetical protein